MFGKSHETTPWEVGPTGPFDRWPTGLGFERFYGNVGGESDMFNPSLRDNTTLVPQSNDPDYYYPTDMTDKAISWIKAQKSLTPDKPFFVYYAALGTHSPVQVPEAWRDKYKGKFDMGWDKAREETLARQKKLGIVPPNTQLAPKPDIVTDWDDAHPRREEGLRPPSGSLRGVRRGDRLRDRQGRAGHRRHGRAGQHPDHLRHRRQRSDRQRRDDRLLQHLLLVQPGARDLARPARSPR